MNRGKLKPATTNSIETTAAEAENARMLNNFFFLFSFFLFAIEQDKRSSLVGNSSVIECGIWDGKDENLHL